MPILLVLLTLNIYKILDMLLMCSKSKNYLDETHKQISASTGSEYILR